MPTSYPAGKSRVVKALKATCDPSWTVLDVGPGKGTYADLLSEIFPVIDAVEIHAPYIQKFGLREKYRKVFNHSIVGFPGINLYDVVILGDVLEHLSIEDAQAVLANAQFAKQIVIAIPYQMKQGAYRGVQSEVHLQDDLTHEIFMRRYPGFPLLASYSAKGHAVYGYYLKKLP
jgi:hypothetical protein